MSRTYAIADMHGRYDLLCGALLAIEGHGGDEGGTLVILGDMVDRGPQSREILELLKQGPHLPQWRWIILQGNHEDMMRRCSRGMAPLSWWMRNGGGQTLMSYGFQNGDILDGFEGLIGEHNTWLDDLPMMHVDDHRIYVHAGVDPGIPLYEQVPQIMQWMLYDDGDPGGWGDFHIVHGHEQFEDGPKLFADRTDLDTMAWYTGRLAIGVFDDAKPGGPVEILWSMGEPA